uniref:Putative 115 kDa protein in type-1 retrotransposable element n=1 Tax=Xenopsylla cheopis TaxID=163159 RepID=A0A6M2DQW1_XENCH
MIRILQGNLNRCSLAQNLLRQRVYEDRIDVCIISEQYQYLYDRSWHSDTSNTAAIWIVNKQVMVSDRGYGDGYAWIKIRGTYIMSVYLSPNDSISEFRQKLADIENTIRGFTDEVIVAGDFNAKSPEWGTDFSDTRGNEVADLIARLDLTVLNIGATSTFRRPGFRESVLDITLASSKIANKVQDWNVSEQYTGSDHQSITFWIEQISNFEQHQNRAKRSWNDRKIDLDALRKSLLQGWAALKSYPLPTTCSETEMLVAKTMKIITKACDASMPRRKTKHSRNPAYWWTNEIAELRKTCLKHRRRATRAAKDSPEQTLNLSEYKVAKKALNRAIKTSKSKLWAELCNELNNDVWGKAYQIVTEKLGRISPESPKSPIMMNQIVEELFPMQPTREKGHYTNNNEVPMFTIPELQYAAKTIKLGKAPGPDGIPTQVIKMIAQEFPDILLNVYNACLDTLTFPAVCKRQRLVLLDKGKGPPITASSFRPLCMLDIAGKLLEKLIQGRLRNDIESNRGFSENQHGFRKGRSTIGAIKDVVDIATKAWTGSLKTRKVCLLLTLDVKNAFNSACWKDILEALEKRFHVEPYNLSMVDSYLNDRALIQKNTQTDIHKNIKTGVPQGSVLGPDLWNADYDELLEISLPKQVHLTGFADDVAATIVADSIEEADVLVDYTIKRISTWLEKHHMKLAKNKTEMVVFPQPYSTIVDGLTLTAAKSVRYLGVQLDAKLTFREHLERACVKASKIVSSLSRIMANTIGPRTKKRRVLLEVVHSVLLYGAEIWAHTLRQKSYRRKLATVQRRGALRVACAYRTVSEAAVLVIAGALPIDLLAIERARLYDLKTRGYNLSEARTRTRKESLEEWQRRWQASDKGRWTARLIPNIKAWLDRKHGEIDFYLTQMLTGHGSFNAYLFRMGLRTSSLCEYCPDKIEDAEHTFFECGKWRRFRADAEMTLGRTLNPESVIQLMLQNSDNWSAVATFARRLLTMKIAERG